MSEFEAFQNDFADPAVQEGSVDPKKNASEEMDIPEGVPDLKVQPKQVNEADQIAHFIVEQTREREGKKSDVGNEKVNNDEALIAKKLEEDTATNKTYSSLNKQMQSEDQVLQNVPLAEQPQKRIELKKEYVKEQRREGRQRVAESTVVLVPEDTAERRQEKLQQRQTIEQDLAMVDTNAFYRQYFAVLKGDQADRPRQLRMLESSLAESLKTAAQLRGADANEYSNEKVHEIFLSLTTSQEVERTTVILYQERMRVALEIDQKLGTNVSGEIQKVIASNLPADEKLRTVDALLDRLAQIRTGDKDLQKKLDELGGLNNEQDAANSAFQIQLIEEHVKTESRAQEVRSTLDVINKNFPGMPEPDIRLFSSGVETGRFELVSAMLQGKVQKMPDGTYEGTVESEKVYIAERDGKIVAELRYQAQRISIPLTDPNAVGFDLARSEKIALETECDDIRAREDIRWALMDQPGDTQFMDERQAEKFQTILRVVIGERGAPAEHALRNLSLLRDNRTVDQKYMDAMKRCFDAWAPDGNFRDLFGVVTQNDLQALVGLWKSEEQDRVEESQTLRVYSLEKIREATPSPNPLPRGEG